MNGGTGTEQVATFGNGSDEESAQLATSWAFAVTAGPRTFALDTIIRGAAGDMGRQRRSTQVALDLCG